MHAPQQAHRTVTNQQQPTRAPAGVLLSIPISEHLGGEDSGAERAATQNAIYRISLLNSLLNSLLIITQIALLIVTHHYTTSDG